jgi:hypothetical protein
VDESAPDSVNFCGAGESRPHAFTASSRRRHTSTDASRTPSSGRSLRDKVDRSAPRHTFIQTRYGVGYKLEAVPKEEPAPSGASTAAA